MVDMMSFWPIIASVLPGHCYHSLYDCQKTPSLAQITLPLVVLMQVYAPCNAGPYEEYLLEGYGEMEYTMTPEKEEAIRLETLLQAT
jgi:hypothetical protein